MPTLRVRDLQSLCSRLARNHKELIVWQLADELRMEVYRLTASTAVARDFKFCAQLRDAVAGVAGNIAEGFRRGSSIDQARFITYALTSMDETEERLEDGVKRRHWRPDELAQATRLVHRLTPAMTHFHAYLLSDEAIERSRALHEARSKRRRRSR